MKKVSVIGHFAKGLDLANGQTIKTKTVTTALKKEIGDEEVITFDTHGSLALLKAPFQCLNALKKSENVIIFPAYKGLRVYAPLLCAFRRLYKSRQLHYVVVGGWLPEFVKGKPFLKKALLHFDGIYVQAEAMKNVLEKQNFNNVYVMHNFKNMKVLNENELVYPTNPPLRLCTFSRVSRQKGIGDAIEAVQTINKKLGYIAYSLDIYGAIDEPEKDWFENLKKQFPPYISYKGVASGFNSVDVLKNYFALLFPTYYKGEGFAGTLIDAYSSGLPVIATDWRYNKEFVNERVGIVYPSRDNVALEEILLKVEKKPEILSSLKKNCLSEAKRYTAKEAMKPLLEKIRN